MSVRKSGKIIAGTPRTTGGVEIGDIGFAPLGIDESLNLRRYLNGQVIIQSQFVSFTNKVKSAIALYPNLAATETNWQAEKTNSKLGQCGKFVVDDTAGTIRLPCVVNAQGLADLQYLGTIKNESLPNITGHFYSALTVISNKDKNAGGFFKYTDYYDSGIQQNNDYPLKTYTINGDASRSSSTYQDNAPVQQEAVQYPYYIQVATGVEETLPAIREYNINTPFFFGQSMYSDVAPDNASWLASNGSYNSRSVYPDYYDWLNSKVGQAITANGGKVVLSTDTITDYDFVVNQTDQTFRLPLLNGEENIPGTEMTSSIFSEITTTAQTYTCPTNGFIFVDCMHNAGTLIVTCNDSMVSANGTGTSDNRESAYFFAKKGDVVTVWLNAGTSNYISSTFTKAVGNGSLYYYVGDTVQDASLINAGAVLGQLSNKADIDASNFNADGKSLLSGLGMPSGRYIDLTVGASGASYTAPANGYVSASTTNSTMCNLHSHGVFVNSTDFQTKDATDRYAMIPVLKGTVFGFYYTGTVSYFKFIYAEGENNV